MTNMKIILKVQLNIEGSRLTQGGEFTTRNKDDIPIVAFEWIQRIKMDTGYRKTIIEKITWNEENDITDDVRKIRKEVIDDLPF
ncbi:MAG: hypothetical protein K0S80_4947 [Neobacillus sp.]|nr:hypothetical protein [Neobacillus sp.]